MLVRLTNPDDTDVVDTLVDNLQSNRIAPEELNTRSPTSGETVLTALLSRGKERYDPEVALALIRHGADVSIAGSSGRNARAVLHEHGIAGSEVAKAERTGAQRAQGTLSSGFANGSDLKISRAASEVLSTADTPPATGDFRTLSATTTPKGSATPSRFQRILDRLGLSSPLHRAVSRKDTAQIKELVREGADINKRTRFAGSVLQTALYSGDANVVAAVVESGADPLGDDVRNVLHHFGGEWSPLLTETDESQPQMIDLLIQAGANLDFEDAVGLTPLLIAVSNRDSDGEDNTDRIRTLLAAGADPTADNKAGLPPLLVIANRDDLPLLQVFVEHGVDVDRPNRYECTALLAAIECGHTEMVKALVAAGADPNLETESGFTPLLIALASQNTMIPLLLRLGADPDRVSFKTGWSAYSAVLSRSTQFSAVLATLFREHAPPTASSRLQRQKMVAHAWSFAGKGTLNLADSTSREIELEGTGGSLDWFREMAAGTRDFPGQQPLARMEEELATTLETAGKMEAPRLVAEAVEAGSPYILETGFTGHTVSVLFCDNKLVLCNRGGLSRKPMEVYELAPGTVTADLVNEIRDLSNKPPKEYKRFVKSLSGRDGFTSSRKNRSARALESACRLRMQRVGNCTWASPETAAFAFMMIHNLREDSENPAAVIGETRQQFKQWITHQRIRSISEYLKVSREHGAAPDHKTMERAFALAWTLGVDFPVLTDELEQVENDYLRFLKTEDPKAHCELRMLKQILTVAPDFRDIHARRKQVLRDFDLA